MKRIRRIRPFLRSLRDPQTWVYAVRCVAPLASAAGAGALFPLGVALAVIGPAIAGWAALVASGVLGLVCVTLSRWAPAWDRIQEARWWSNIGEDPAYRAAWAAVEQDTNGRRYRASVTP